MNTESTIALPASIDKVVITREIELTESDLIANEEMLDIWEKSSRMDKEIKLQVKALDRLKDKMKAYMGKAEILLSPAGEELVVYKQNPKYPSFSKETLELMYPAIYKECIFMKDGNRNFCLK